MNASTVSKEEVRQELKQLLVPNEEITAAFKLVRDLLVFTNKRLIMVDKQGLTGKKIEYHSLPYKFISHFSVETAGRFDLDSELKIWISGSEALTLSKQFGKNSSNIRCTKTFSFCVYVNVLSCPKSRLFFVPNSNHFEPPNIIFFIIILFLLIVLLLPPSL